MSELNVYRGLNLKPNYAELSRVHGVDWRTIKKYDGGYEGKAKTRDKPSKLDPYKEEITNKLNIPRTTRKGVYEYLINTYGIEKIGTYSNFKVYVRKHKLKNKSKSTGAPRYETIPGELMEIDWKEDITLRTKKGELITFNVFHMVLKYSRYSYIEIAISKEQETVFRCLINGFRYFGGITNRLLFDNMRTAAVINSKGRKVNASMQQFAKEFGFHPQLCKPRTPYTKGTNEARNKILDWFRPYEDEVESYEDLMGICAHINDTMNLEICEGTGVQPIVLFLKEKEYLNSLPNREIIERYLAPTKVKVSNDSTIYYKKSRYSVRSKLIDEFVELEEFNNKLYIYYKGKLETVHDISKNPINYKPDHYEELIKGKVREEDIMKTVKTNLSLLDNLFNERKYEIDLRSAVKSLDSLAAYIVTHQHSENAMRNYIALSHEDRNRLLNEMKKLIPYIKDEFTLMQLFPTLLKKGVNHFAVNVWIFDYQSDSILNEEGKCQIYSDLKEIIDTRLVNIERGKE